MVERLNLDGDTLSPEEYLEARRQIAYDLDKERIGREEAADALLKLDQDNPAVVAAWQADVQSRL